MGVAADAARWFAVEGGYGADAWRDTFGVAFTNGVFAGVGNELQVYADSTGMQVKVKSGQGLIEGRDADFGSETILPIAPHSSDRIDRVVKRITEGSLLFELDTKVGSTGTPPSLTQNTSVWEESLAQVLVDSGSTIAAGKVTDERRFVTAAGGLIVCLSTNRPPGVHGLGIYERDTDRVRFYDGSSWRWVPGTGQQVGCGLSRTGTVSAADSTWTGFALTEDYDNSSMHSGTNGYVLIPSTGLYDVIIDVEFAGNATGDRMAGIDIAPSGTPWASGAPSHIIDNKRALSGGSSTTHVGKTKQFNLAAGTAVTALGWQSSTGALNIVSANLIVRLAGYSG